MGRKKKYTEKNVRFFHWTLQLFENVNIYATSPISLLKKPLLSSAKMMSFLFLARCYLVWLLVPLDDRPPHPTANYHVNHYILSYDRTWDMSINVILFTTLITLWIIDRFNITDWSVFITRKAAFVNVFLFKKHNCNRITHFKNKTIFAVFV